MSTTEEVSELKILLDNAYDLSDTILRNEDCKGMKLLHLDDTLSYISEAGEALSKYLKEVNG